MSALDETIAFAAIDRLQSAYADTVSGRRFGHLAELMSPACEVRIDLVDRNLSFVGPLAIGGFISEQIERFGFFQLSILNSTLEIDADAGRAAGRVRIHEVRSDAATGARTDTYGVYHDLYERDSAGRWWFAHRRYRSNARTPAEGGPTHLAAFETSEMELTELLSAWCGAGR